MNIFTGAISVASCPTPGEAPCLDYIHQSRYNLTLIARDSNGEGLSITTNIIIHLLTDRKLVYFVLPSYSTFVLENTLYLNPSIAVEVKKYCDLNIINTFQ